ncbi:acyltransferase family protein [Ramlibacter sp. MMS24-I3-19]|uniref:acyltransferase family protein n=1 Tax=Ramlibacter sp. MMS24-I3-19 TaxID=3416606 RepID=UPI003D08A464
MVTSKTNKEKFDAVQVLRALAAALVVFQHAVMNWAEKAIAPGPIPYFPDMGDYGVKLFFCISGFIIVHTATALPSGWDSSKTFWRRRIRRIVPLYWIVTAAYLVKTVASGQHVGLAEVLQSYFFIPYVNPHGLVQPILGQGWSLNYEMLFYLAFGATFFLPRRWHAPAVAALMTALAAARAFGWLGNPASAGALYYWADAIVLYFVAGVVACLVAQQWRSRKWPGLSQGWAALVASAIVVAFAGFALPADEPLAFGWMPAACIVPLLLCITAQPRPIGAIWQPIVIAGDASYSTYLTHGFLMGPLARLLGGLSVTGSLGYHGFAWICVVACTAAGYLIFVGLERPLHTGRFPRPFGKRRPSVLQSHAQPVVPVVQPQPLDRAQ